MKVLVRIIPVFLVVLLAVGWYSGITDMMRSALSSADFIGAAEDSVESGLYDQAIEQYERALEVEQSADVYQRIGNVYAKYYEEEPRDEIRDRYISVMETAANTYPSEVGFWEQACDLYLQAEEYSNAYNLLARAESMGASSDKLAEISKNLSHASELSNRMYADVKDSLNGVASVDTGGEYQVLDATGKRIVEGYKFIGPINSDGAGIYVNDIDARLLDSNTIARGRYALEVEDAGEVDSETGIVPVCIDDTWRYLDTASGELLEGEYVYAGRFTDGKAAVQLEKTWHLIGVDGSPASEDVEEIKLDLHGSWIHAGVALVKTEGLYRICNADLQPVSEFACDDIDVYAEEGSALAFKSDGKWGFVSPDGEVLCEPTYKGAKSFANGFAGVSENGVLWGFVDDAYGQVIDFLYADVRYFNPQRRAWVSESGDAYQLLNFVFG